MSLKARLRIAIVALVTFVVIAMSVLYLYDFTRMTFRAASERANLIVEEAAQMAIFAEVLGGAKNIPPEMLKATVGRRDEFARAGTQRA